MNGLISVIVPVHNAERFLSDCLGSLTDQTYRKLEILVIDDGSTDGSAALCRRWQEKDGRIRFFSEGKRRRLLRPQSGAGRGEGRIRGLCGRGRLGPAGDVSGSSWSCCRAGTRI